MSDNVTRRHVNAGIGTSLLTATLAGTRAFTQGTDIGAKSIQPNIVFFLVDNAGWGDLGVYGGMTPTPRIDALAGQGIRFNNYNVEPQCTPTRSAILTGRMPIRQGTYTVPLPGQGPYGLSPWEYTLAHLLSGCRLLDGIVRKVALWRGAGPLADRRRFRRVVGPQELIGRSRIYGLPAL